MGIFEEHVAEYFTYKSLPGTIFKNRGLRVESEEMKVSLARTASLPQGQGWAAALLSERRPELRKAPKGNSEAPWSLHIGIFRKLVLMILQKVKVGFLT